MNGIELSIYRNACDKYAVQKYGIYASELLGGDDFAQYAEDQFTPKQLVEHIAEKYDLTSTEDIWA